jgi:hypothetical protein
VLVRGPSGIPGVLASLAAPTAQASDFFYGPGGEFTSDSVAGPVLHQGRNASPDPALSQLVVLFRHDSGDHGAGSLRGPGDNPGRDHFYRVLRVCVSCVSCLSASSMPSV